MSIDYEILNYILTFFLSNFCNIDKQLSVFKETDNYRRIRLISTDILCSRYNLNGIARAITNANFDLLFKKYNKPPTTNTIRNEVYLLTFG